MVVSQFWVRTCVVKLVSLCGWTIMICVFFINSSAFLSWIRIHYVWALQSRWAHNACFVMERIWFIQLRQMSNHQFSLPSMKIVTVICSCIALAASGSIVNAHVQPSMSIVIMIGFASSASTNVISWWLFMIHEWVLVVKYPALTYVNQP